MTSQIQSNTSIAKIAEAQQAKRAKTLAARTLQPDPPPPPTDQQRIILMLVKDGLISNEPWVPTNIDFGYKFLPAITNCQISAALFCATHHNAPQYLTQAPILASIDFKPNQLEQKFVQTRKLLQDRPKLGNFMRKLGFAKELRKIHPEAIGNFPQQLTSLLTPKLCAYIPNDPIRQIEWAIAVNTAFRHSQQIFEWVCRNVIPQHGLLDILDYMHSSGDNSINYTWGWGRMLRASHEWHQRFQVVDGVPLKLELDLDLSSITSIEDVLFHELLTEVDLQTEGRAMQHCVAGYYVAVHRGYCRIFRVYSKELPHIATLEIAKGGTPPIGFITSLPPSRWARSDYQSRQLKGFRNKDITNPIIIEAVNHFILEVNNGTHK